MHWNPSRVLTRSVASALATAALLAGSVPSALAQGEIGDADVEPLGVTIEDLRELEPNPAWDPLGLVSEDGQRLLAAVEEPVSPTPYAFGDDLDTPPVIQPSGALVVALGVMGTTVPDGWAPPPTGLSGSSLFAQTDTIAPGTDMTLVWVRFDSAWDPADGLTLNEGITVAVPGLPVWNSTFEGDTWEGANVIPNARWENGQLSFAVNRYEPPQSFLPTDLPAFYFRNGDIMAVGVATAALDAIGQQDVAAESAAQPQTLLWTGTAADVFAQGPSTLSVATFGMHLHTAVRLFESGFVVRLPPTTSSGFGYDLADLFFPERPEPEPEPEPEPAEEVVEEEAATPEPAQPEPEPEEPAEEEVDEPLVDPEPADDGGGFPLIFVGVAIAVIGALLVLFGPRLVGGTRTRDDEGAGTTAGGEDEDDDDPRDTPAPSVYGEEVGYDRWSYKLELRHWRGWSDLRGSLTAMETVDVGGLDFDKDPWLCDYRGKGELFVAIRGVEKGKPAATTYVGVHRLGLSSSTSKEGKQLDDRFGLERKESSVPSGDRKRFLEAFGHKQDQWANAVKQTGWLNAREERLRSQAKSYTHTQPNVDYHHLSKHGGWQLGRETPFQQQFQVLAIWAVFVKEPAEHENKEAKDAWDKAWGAFLDGVVDHVTAEIQTRAKAAVTSAAGKIGELAIGAAEAAASGDDEKTVPGSVVVGWDDVPKGWLPMPDTYPTSTEKLKYGSSLADEAWAQARRSTSSGRAILDQRVDADLQNWVPDVLEELQKDFLLSSTRWQLFAENLDCRLHVEERRNSENT